MTDTADYAEWIQQAQWLLAYAEEARVAGHRISPMGLAALANLRSTVAARVSDGPPPTADAEPLYRLTGASAEGDNP